MVRVFILIFVFTFFINLKAQEENFRYVSVLKGDATITPGFMLNAKQTNIYINGSLEYFPEEKVSLRGEVFWMVGSQQKPALLQDNSSVLFGGLYHFHKNRFDYFVGLETGVSMTKPMDSFGLSYKNPVSVITPVSYDYKILPVFSPVTGITFYASNYFNFFLNARYVKATYFGYTGGKTLSLDEIRISAGLGFLIHLKKK